MFEHIPLYRCVRDKQLPPCAIGLIKHIWVKNKMGQNARSINFPRSEFVHVLEEIKSLQ